MRLRADPARAQSYEIQTSKKLFFKKVFPMLLSRNLYPYYNTKLMMSALFEQRAAKQFFRSVFRRGGIYVLI